MRLPQIQGKKITLMGLGLLGRGVGDAYFLLERGAELIITDLKNKEALQDSLDKLSQFKNVTFVLGEHRLEDFRDRDLIIKAAGVPLDSPYIAEARANKIPIRMSADLFMEYADIKTIGVTGTRGKSTVTHMIAHILKEAGKKVILGGNIRGISTLSLLPEVQGDEVAVLELDSWQCQGLAEAQISPHVAVFSTFFDDHMDYYKNDKTQYLRDKANIFLYQKPDDTFVLGSQCRTMVHATYNHDIRAKTVTPPPFLGELLVVGGHNFYNAGLAYEAARAVHIKEDMICSALATFKGLSGRLEFVREIQGVKFYNDTTATTPDATIAALNSFSSSTHLIMGGADKNLDMSALLKILPQKTKKVYALQGTGTERVKDLLPAGTQIYQSMHDALTASVSEAKQGESILLSPAFASFGMFKNEYDRGDQFDSLVRAL